MECGTARGQYHEEDATVMGVTWVQEQRVTGRDTTSRGGAVLIPQTASRRSLSGKAHVASDTVSLFSVRRSYKYGFKEGSLGHLDSYREVYQMQNGDPQRQSGNPGKTFGKLAVYYALSQFGITDYDSTVHNVCFWNI
ncbi:hypothetical protein UY3_11222 [Chelonia mydas]|uniref:Uncharacterized protein n=1 Tax=Chelonia mydas TaxID=8469 RepID=M7B7X2_CHEMY|nr:hypothetical protein UY3_11222 [Chelonia mydas]